MGGLLVIAMMSRPLGAQRPLSVDIGLAAARFPDESLKAVGPVARLSASSQHGPFFASMSGLALGTFGGATGSATLEGGARTKPYSGWSAEFGGELSSVVGSTAGGGAGTAIANGRAMWANADGGSWLRVTASYSNRADASLQGHGMDAGLWWAGARTQLSLSLAHEWTDAQLFLGPARANFVGTVPVRYTDALVALHTEGDRATFDVSAGARRDPDAAHIVEPIVNATAAFWADDTKAVVFSVARSLPDWIRGADAADVVSVGMRFMQGTPAADRSARLIPVVLVAESADENHVLRVRAAGARRVAIKGDFSDWQEMELTANGAVFERAVNIGSGSHRILVRIDGGEWRTAANTPGVDDDFGGRVGLLVVP
ncbi:MAG: glycogen-binding domain-containing protein [bacterium]